VEDIELPGHAELDEAMQAAGAECGAAESHGTICGMICATGSATKRGWLEHLLGEGNTLSAASRIAADMLATLYAGTLLKFNDGARVFSTVWRSAASGMTAASRKT